MLGAAGWQVQARDKMNHTAAPGVPVCEFPLTSGGVDCLLFADGRRVGVVETKKVGVLLSGEPEMDPELQDRPLATLGQVFGELPKEVVYDAGFPIETFDFIVIDECHRSIYNVWRQVLEYFDAYLIDISPRDEAATSYPLYQRDHLRGETAPMKAKRRFVSEAIIRRWQAGRRPGVQPDKGQRRSLRVTNESLRRTREMVLRRPLSGELDVSELDIAVEQHVWAGAK